MTCRMSWKAVPKATGYQVRFGIAPDKLYSAYQAYRPQAYITTLNAGVSYWYTIDSFNENGVREGTEIYRM